MPSKPTTERGTVYGVELLSSLPLDGSGLMHQALPSRNDLEQVRKVSERTAAGYEVVLEHYQRAVVAANEAEAIIVRLSAGLRGIRREFGHMSINNGTSTLGLFIDMLFENDTKSARSLTAAPSREEG